MTSKIRIWLSAFIALACSATPAFSHTIHTKDGKTISSPDVWEETKGYFLDDVSLYGCKQAGMPVALVNKLTALENQMLLTKEQHLARIETLLGAANFQKYRAIIEKYIEQKIVVSYEKMGNTISIEKNLVEKIIYDAPPAPISVDMIQRDDAESRRAIKAEEQKLYQLLQEMRKEKASVAAGDPEKYEYEREAQKIQARITELKYNPIGYFLRYAPKRVSLSAPLKPEECTRICGGTASTVEKSTIRDDSEEAAIFQRCMARCAHPVSPAQERDTERKDNRQEEDGFLKDEDDEFGTE